ncbi:MAG: hypothetical protein CBC35_00490 [Planctomycetes bacterium TMED75]|nr:phosphopantothenoylcysteine decarboxylase [Planctomycetaceae bacterium]OUU96820.1 MAG: hypothetical protein CBC35_00490 [Planctomycetes bacterium TMED75]
MSDAPRVLISAGPTYEPIDAVRYLGNRSSGRLGSALATAAVAAGCQSTLLLGPTSYPAPKDSSISTQRFQSCADLQSLLEEHWPNHDLLLMAAAVADYRPCTVRTDEKLRRAAGRLSLELEATPDLLAELAARSRPDQTRIGWALEPRDRLVESARAKLERKQLDAIVANPLETLDSDEIEPMLVLADGSMHTPAPKRLAKSDFAAWLLVKSLELHRKA